jgi:hypothetical protein
MFTIPSHRTSHNKRDTQEQSKQVAPYQLLATKILYLGLYLHLGLYLYPRTLDLDLFLSHIQERGQQEIPTYTGILPEENIDIHNPTYTSPPSAKSASAEVPASASASAAS